MEIDRALPADAALLSGIAVRAKRHWGYPETWLRAWTDALTITADYVRAHPTFLARDASGRALGFCAVRLAPPEAQLDHLWIEPGAMRRGVGRALFHHAETVARATGATRLLIEGDPHAEGFYRRMGALIVGWSPAPMEGAPDRALPRLEKQL